MAQRATVKELPAETLRYPRAVYTAASGTVYYITQLRPDGVPQFTLWEQTGSGCYRKLDVADSPLALYDNISSYELNKKKKGGC